MVVYMKKKISIIGAGLGGMSAAICCAAAGYDVTIYEKNDKVGGKLNMLERDGFGFDLGPSILTLPHIFRQVFQTAGKRFDDYVDIVSLNIHWRNFFEDKTVLDFCADIDKTKRELEKLEPGSAKSFDRFLTYTQTLYDITDKKYFNKGLDTFWSFFRAYDWYTLFFKLDIFRTMNRGVEQHFKNQHIRDALNFFIKYVGSSAYNAPGFMNLMPWVQWKYGLWYVKGGMYNLARGMEKVLRELNVSIKFGHEVRALEKSGDHISALVLDNGEKHAAQMVISNMEVIPVYRELLKEPPVVLKKLSKFEPACSGLVLHIGTNKKFPALAHHNFFFSGNQRKHFSSVFDEYKIPEDPTLYVVAPTRSDPAKAPEGCDNIKILPHIPYIQDTPFSQDDYVALRNRILEKMERMGLEGLRESIVVEDMLTPNDIERMYKSNKGSIYGVVSDKKKNFALKAPKKSSLYKNLYFVGGSVNPGGGMPMVTLSGYNTAKLVLKDYSR